MGQRAEALARVGRVSARAIAQRKAQRVAVGGGGGIQQAIICGVDHAEHLQDKVQPAGRRYLVPTGA